MSASHDVPPSLKQATETIGATRGQALQLRSAFDQSLIPMVLIDNDRRYREANAAARLLARISLEAIRRLRVGDFMAQADLPVLDSAWEELLERGQVNGRLRSTFPDGSHIWIFYAGIANALPGLHLVAFAPADWPDEEIEEIQPGGQPADAALSQRQLDVLRLVAAGASAGQIATELSISEATVRTHVKNILERLGAHNRAHAVALAMTQGLLGDGAGFDSP